ncbi:MAG: hypothetical protein A2W25_15745 [candidate division Zixibacteria bacterium RBG_16_53_22]|nr:MAG: hypothetical protein A2W25_15745 [candidate division Zixibacteria bacterium RBG_16_53_22]
MKQFTVVLWGIMVIMVGVVITPSDAVGQQPSVIEVWPIDSTTLEVLFDRVMDPWTTESPGNYSTVHGLGIYAASLDTSGRTVYLITAAQPGNCVDTLVTIGPCDTSFNCMVLPDSDGFNCGVGRLEFYQLDLVYIRDSVFQDSVINSDWGQVLLTYLGADSILYFNLTVDTVWVIQNIPVLGQESVGVSQTMTYSFPIASVSGLEITEIGYAYQLSDTVLTQGPQDLALRWTAVRDGLVRLGRGFGDAIDPIFGPAQRLIGGQVIGSQHSNRSSKHSYEDLPNQECGISECCPTAVSNCLNSLNSQHHLGIPPEELTIGRMKLATNWGPKYVYDPVHQESVWVEGCWIFHDDDRPPGENRAWYEDKMMWLVNHQFPISTRVISNIGIGEIQAEIDRGQVVELQTGSHTAAVKNISDLGNGLYAMNVAHDIIQGEDGGCATTTVVYDRNIDSFIGGGFGFSWSPLRYFVVECPYPPGPDQCSYTPGDINGSGTPNGIDVTYGVAYFKGIVPPPPVDCNPPCTAVPDPFYAAMDVNGTCSTNGIDITYYVSYLKGQQPSLLYCEDCPPADGILPVRSPDIGIREINERGDKK